MVVGVEIAVRTMKKSEKSLVKVKFLYAYGTTDNSIFDVPSNTDVEFEVELKNFDVVSLFRVNLLSLLS